MYLLAELGWQATVVNGTDAIFFCTVDVTWPPTNFVPRVLFSYRPLGTRLTSNYYVISIYAANSLQKSRH